MSKEINKPVTIKNFHCSQHGFQTPNPKCPKCEIDANCPQGVSEERVKKAKEEFDDFIYENGVDDRDTKVYKKLHQMIDNLLSSQRSELLKMVKEEIEKASEQIQGGGNGRRILIQLADEITKKIK